MSDRSRKYRKNQCVDKNGNSETVDNLNNNFYNGSSRGMVVEGNENDDDETLKPKKQIDQKALNRLQAMAMSDDDDYGKAAFEQL